MEESTILTWTGLALNIFGLVFSVYSILSGNRIKRLILKEKNMIRNRILDIVRVFQADIDSVMNDRKMYNDPKRNTAEIRIEYLR